MNRIAAKVRTNWDFQLAQKIAKEFGIALKVEAASGKGHPKAVFVHARGETRWPIASSPGGRGNSARVRHRILRALQRDGAIAEVKP